MKSKLNFDELAEAGSPYNFGKMIKSEAPSLSREVSGASAISTASSIRDFKSSFFDNVEKLGAKRYDFYKENINYFTQILLRNTPQGLAIYKDWYEEFVESSYFELYYVLWNPLKSYLDKYMFDSAIEDLLDVEIQEGLDGDEDVIALYMQTIIPNKQIEDIEKGNILLLTTFFCLTLSLENDIDFLEDLPLMYPKDLYETSTKVKEFKQVMKSIYLKDAEIKDEEIDSDLEEDDDDKVILDDDDDDDDDDAGFVDKLKPKTKKVLFKYFDFVKSNYEVVLEENPEFEIDDDEFYKKLIELYSVVNVKFKIYNESNKLLLLDMTEYILNYPEKTNEEILDDFDDYDEDEDKAFVDTLKPETKKILFNYFDFVKSNYEGILEENPEFEIDDDEFYKKLIEIYSVVNVKFKIYNEKNDEIMVDITSTLLNNLDKTNEEILDDPF